MINKTLAQRNDNPLSPSKYSSGPCLNLLRYFGEIFWGIFVWFLKEQYIMIMSEVIREQREGFLLLAGPNPVSMHHWKAGEMI